MNKLSHTNSEGKANMVDVGHKPNQLRTAKAEGLIKLSDETIRLIRENQIKKGDVITLAEVAGIQAAKRTSDLIPLCHPLQLTKVDVKAIVLDDGVRIKSTVRCVGKTGVEMEALHGVTVALLTIYDMCKAVDKHMKICDIKLLDKTKENIA
ncbi:MAG: cyclic pyranopterin monophosphate synthase MoaC [Bacteroidetes bacterium]|nr:MAG: cyclic pyranopterin monophosphate synthase MoaC [Bacteroidota bacterium]RLD69264.1 MAG: cyclic pyranopterin monophosphate synthase MoaC [Bacteroidota bacterium]RLD88272.1 MAG: cyclic pyranopterin monophosphate synthase MoaC [Bacteroidota bacterium]